MSSKKGAVDKGLTEIEKMEEQKYEALLKKQKMRASRYLENMGFGDLNLGSGSTSANRGIGKEEPRGRAKLGGKKEGKMEIKKGVKTPELKKTSISAPMDYLSRLKLPETLQRQLATRWEERNAKASSEVAEGEITKERRYRGIICVPTKVLVEAGYIQPDSTSAALTSPSASSSSSGQVPSTYPTSWNNWQRKYYYGNEDSDSDSD